MNAAAQEPAAPRPAQTVSLRVTLTLAVLSMFGPFATDTIFPAFHTMGEAFGASETAMQQVTTVYLLSFAVMSLFHGPISDSVGRKPVMIVATGIFAAASVGAALSTSLPMLLVFRCLQGLSAGGGTIIARAVIPDLLSGAAAARAMGRVQMIFGVAPAVAPVVGGWLLKLGPWPVIFWFLVVYGLVCMASAATLPESHPPEKRSPLRLGKVLSSSFSVLTTLRFLRVGLTGAICFGSVFCYIGGAPLFVVNLLHAGERDFWILFVPLIIGMTTGSWLSGRLAARLSREQVISLGLLIALVGILVNIAQAALGAPALPWAVIGPGIMAFGMMMQLPANQLFAMELFPDRRGAVASAAGFLQLLSSALITGVVTPYIMGSILTLALSSGLVFGVGALMWIWHLLGRRRTPQD